ncbi:amino acid dehydrogenase [Betaproteobacteria bacterium SCGC AG-212-J23]|nr:amino acid dehydrogenase [Betaproteobacteria bacterium SCGC AG-212-J23]
MKVIVLGAGVIGVTSAWYLAEAGHEVTVVDRRAQPALETSFANGGQISAGHAEPWAKPAALPKILKWLGHEDAPLLFRPRLDWAQWRWGLGFLRECVPGRFERNSRALAGLAAYSRECLQALRRSTGIRYDELTRGILQFATRKADLETLKQQAAAMREFGARREFKTAAECVALEPALKNSREPVLGGLYDPHDESGDAHKFTLELARRCEQRGVQFRYGHVATRIEVAGDRVEGVDGLQGDAYVVALGSYSPLLLRPLGIRIPVYPLKGYSITLETKDGPTVSLTDEAAKIVISRLGNRLRAAGTAELAGYDTSINAARCDAILRRVRTLFPDIVPGEIKTWAGLRPATPSNVPVIGRTRFSNLFLDTGHGTLGWTLACGSGKALADLVSGRRPEVDFHFS